MYIQNIQAAFGDSFIAVTAFLTTRAREGHMRTSLLCPALTNDCRLRGNIFGTGINLGGTCRNDVESRDSNQRGCSLTRSKMRTES